MRVGKFYDCDVNALHVRLPRFGIRAVKFPADLEIGICAVLGIAMWESRSKGVQCCLLKSLSLRCQFYSQKCFKPQVRPGLCFSAAFQEKVELEFCTRSIKNKYWW